MDPLAEVMKKWPFDGGHKISTPSARLVNFIQNYAHFKATFTDNTHPIFVTDREPYKRGFHPLKMYAHTSGPYSGHLDNY